RSSRSQPTLQLRDRGELVPTRRERRGQTVNFGVQALELGALDGRERRLEPEENPADPALLESAVERLPHLQEAGGVREEGRDHGRWRPSGRGRGSLRHLLPRRQI